MKINARFVNPFIQAGINVVQQIANIDVRRGHLSYKDQPEPSYGVCIIVGVYGFLKGQVVYSMKTEVAKRLVDKMLDGKSPEERKLLFLDTLGELANMITGNATALLSENKDHTLKITTPAIATGENLNIMLVPKPTLILGLYTQYGPIEISVALEEDEVLNEIDETERMLNEI
ncbi:MAG: chemotaxis protein CheX [Spirochaetaceae bacterium]|nr:chemotaxis protein CheX [Spirochaetaceae bacterium]